MIRQQVYVFDGSLRGTSSRLTPDRLVASRGSPSGPLVSCLTVTRGELAKVRAAIGYFRQQTYRDKELVLVCGTPTAALRQLIEASGADTRLVPADGQLSLGMLRNVSVDAARGEIVCLWDDDDIYGAHRLERAVGALLQSRADAVFLRQLCLWSPGRKLLRLSNTRVWEGSMVAFKQVLPRYPDAARAEDTALVEAMLQTRSLALMDDPLSYCYCVHGQNTSDELHFDRIFSNASLKLSYGRALAALSSCLAFDRHPGLTEPDRIMLAENAGKVGELRRLETYVAVNQLLRRLRYRFRRQKG